MARLVTCGFEISATGHDFAPAGTIDANIQNTTFRSGARALRINSLSSSTQKAATWWKRSSSNGPHFIRVYVRVATAPSAANKIIGIRSASATTPKVFIILNNDRTLQLGDEDGNIGSPSSALSLNTWYMVDLKSDTTAAAGSHIVEGRLEGSVFATASNRSISQTPYIVQIGGNLGQEAQTTGDWYFDDMAWNDGSGSAQTSYPGAGKVIILRPSGAGDNADWTRAGSDSGANWSQNEENPPNNITDYVESTTLNQTDTYAMDDTTSEIASGDTVNVVSVSVKHRCDQNTAIPGIKTRILSASGGTVLESATLTPVGTSWQTDDSFDSGSISNLFYSPQFLQSYTNPTGGAAWTKALLDTMLCGFKLTTDNTNKSQVTSIWAYVDFTPVVVTTPFTKNLNINQALNRGSTY